MRQLPGELGVGVRLERHVEQHDRDPLPALPRTGGRAGARGHGEDGGAIEHVRGVELRFDTRQQAPEITSSRIGEVR
jgi:hypothetical protein